MATVSKTITENDESSYKATWNFSLTGTNTTITGSTFTFNPTLTAKMTYSGKNYAGCALGFSMNSYSFTRDFWLGASSLYSIEFTSWASGATKTVPLRTTSAINTSQVFNSSNKTSRTVNITASTYELSTASCKGSDFDQYWNGYTQTASEVSWGTIATLTLDAPPNVTVSALSKNTAGGYYKDETTVSCTLSGVSAQYGGTITETKLTIGSQTATGTGNGTLSIALNATGTFTPTVTVTDSRGQITTKTLSDITVTEKPPTFTVSTLSKDTTDYYAGLTTVSCTISSATAYGGTVSSSKLTIGSQTATGTGNGTLSILLNATGTFTPTVQVTDSNGLTTTKTLTGITVVYSPPVCTASVTSASPYIRGYTAYTVNITGATAYGGTISSIVLNVGGQTDSRTTNGTLSVTPTAVGTYTPTVVITDSNGKSTTKTLSSITVQEATPPTFTATVTSSGSYVRTISSYTVNVTNATASYGGTISNIVLTLGSQTANRTSNGSLSITPNTAGTFTPTVTVTDNRGLSTTQELASMTVLAYDKPSMSMTVMRTNSSGVADNEGTYGLITATINYTKARANLNKPTTTVTTEGGTSSTPTVTWYTTYSSSSGVSNAVNWTNYNPNSPVTLYGLINGSFTGSSYKVSCNVSDSLNQTSATITQTISASFYTIDIQAGGKEISFGAPANDNVSGYPEGFFRSNMYSVIKGCPEFVVGTQTASTGSWTGVSKQPALYDGMQINYWLPYAGSGNATLNLTLSSGSTTGAKNVYWRGSTRLTTHYPAGSAIKLTYRSSGNVNGTTYEGWWADGDYDANQRRAFYGTCTTAASTATKVVTLSSTSGWELAAGTIVGVKFTNTNTANNPTLNVNSTGDKSIYYNTSVVTTSNLNKAGYASRVTYYMYDGTNWVWLNWGVDDNTTYSAMSSSEISTGTATTQRTMRADYLRAGLLDLFYPVGSYYETSNTSFDPNTTWGGTWELEAEGQVHISAGTNYTVSGALNNTSDGGKKDAIVPYHTHIQNQHAHTITYPCFAGDSGKLHYETGGGLSGSGSKYAYIEGGSTNRYVTGVNNQTATNQYAGTQGNEVDANMQPYIIVKRWHRTA